MPEGHTWAYDCVPPANLFFAVKVRTKLRTKPSAELHMGYVGGAGSERRAGSKRRTPGLLWQRDLREEGYEKGGPHGGVARQAAGAHPDPAAHPPCPKVDADSPSARVRRPSSVHCRAWPPSGCSGAVGMPPVAAEELLISLMLGWLGKGSWCALAKVSGRMGNASALLRQRSARLMS